MRITLNNSDYIGAAAGILCIIHCIVTPLLFLINAQLVTQKTEDTSESDDQISELIKKIEIFINQ